MICRGNDGAGVDSFKNVLKRLGEPSQPAPKPVPSECVSPLSVRDHVPCRTVRVMNKLPGGNGVRERIIECISSFWTRWSSSWGRFFQRNRRSHRMDLTMRWVSCWNPESGRHRNPRNFEGVGAIITELPEKFKLVEAAAFIHG